MRSPCPRFRFLAAASAVGLLVLFTTPLAAAGPRSADRHTAAFAGAEAGVSAVPEPASLLVLGAVLIATAMSARRKRSESTDDGD